MVRTTSPSDSIQPGRKAEFHQLNLKNLMVNRLFPKRLALMFAALCCCSILGTAIVTSPAKAQCPDASWTSGSTVQMLPGTSCEITIYYCMKDSDGAVYVLVYQVDPTDDGGCVGISNEFLIKQARTLVLNDPLVNRGVPCYKGSPQIVSVWMAECWNTHAIGPEHPDLLGLYGCGLEHLCSKTCYICFDAGGMHITGCDTTPPPISELCPLPPSPYNWEIDQCYTISCVD